MCDKHPWTLFVLIIQEDEALTSAINELKDDLQWIKVEKILRERFGIKNRSGKQCRERWCNNLDPNCRKREWTEEEDAVIFNYQQKFGNNWSKIAQFLVGRSDNTIKNHFYATIRRKLRKFNKMSTEKINKSLKDVINDKELVKFLIEIPEKPKPCLDVEVYLVCRRRSARISKKTTVEGQNYDQENLKGMVKSTDLMENNRESHERRFNGTKEEEKVNEEDNSVFFEESPTNLLQMSTFNLTQDYQLPANLSHLQILERSQVFPSFTLSTSFQFHSLDSPSDHENV
jgi:hypothetical protein